jgi:hypothetical protein
VEAGVSIDEGGIEPSIKPFVRACTAEYGTVGLYCSHLDFQRGASCAFGISLGRCDDFRNALLLFRNLAAAVPHSACLPVVSERVRLFIACGQEEKQTFCYGSCERLRLRQFGLRR